MTGAGWLAALLLLAGSFSLSASEHVGSVRSQPQPSAHARPIPVVASPARTNECPPYGTATTGCPLHQIS